MAKITKKEVLTLCKEIDSSVKYINNGGCGVFAYLVGKALSKFDNCEVNVRVENWSGDAKNLNTCVPWRNIDDMDEWTKNGVYFSHILLEIKLNGRKFMLDSTGEYKLNRSLMEGKVEVSAIHGIVRNSRGWNTCFNRKQISHIAKIVRKWLVTQGVAARSISVSGWQTI